MDAFIYLCITHLWIWFSNEKILKGSHLKKKIQWEMKRGKLYPKKSKRIGKREHVQLTWLLEMVSHRFGLCFETLLYVCNFYWFRWQGLMNILMLWFQLDPNLLTPELKLKLRDRLVSEIKENVSESRL